MHPIPRYLHSGSQAEFHHAEMGSQSSHTCQGLPCVVDLEDPGIGELPPCLPLPHAQPELGGARVHAPRHCEPGLRVWVRGVAGVEKLEPLRVGGSEVKSPGVTETVHKITTYGKSVDTFDDTVNPV